MANGPTRSQINFINKLTESDAGRLEESENFLKHLGKGSVSELTVPEASSLIDKLKKIHVAGDEMSRSGPTDKQIKFIGNLQDSEERIKYTTKFLSGINKKNYSELTLSEASSLIDGLMGTKGSGSANTSRDFNVTPKQVNFIKSLQTSERETKISSEFLTSLGKKSVEELTRTEASKLIEKLKK